MDEESLLETPLDEVEPYGLFKQCLLSLWPILKSISIIADCFLALQREQPQFYTNLMGQLNAQEQQILQSAVLQADAVAQQATLAAAQRTNGAA